jgi:hypothetical protein
MVKWLQEGERHHSGGDHLKYERAVLMPVMEACHFLCSNEMLGRVSSGYSKPQAHKCVSPAKYGVEKPSRGLLGAVPPERDGERGAGAANGREEGETDRKAAKKEAKREAKKERKREKESKKERHRDDDPPPIQVCVAVMVHPHSAALPCVPLARRCLQVVWDGIGGLHRVLGFTVAAHTCSCRGQEEGSLL